MTNYNGENIVAVPPEAPSYMRIGCITHKRFSSSRLGEIYISAIKKYIQ